MKKTIKKIKFTIGGLFVIISNSKLITKIKNNYKVRKFKRNLKIKKKEADNKHILNGGRRYHVIRTTGARLIVVDNTFVKRYNKKISKLKKGKKITIKDLIELSLYTTSCNSPVDN